MSWSVLLVGLLSAVVGNVLVTAGMQLERYRRSQAAAQAWAALALIGLGVVAIGALVAVASTA